MKKSLIALAIVGAMAAPMVAQAEGADFDTTSRIFLHQAMECNSQARPGNAPVSCFRAAAYQKRLAEMYKGGHIISERMNKRVELGQRHVAQAVRKIKGE